MPGHHGRGQRMTGRSRRTTLRSTTAPVQSLAYRTQRSAYRIESQMMAKRKPTRVNVRSTTCRRERRGPKRAPYAIYH
eukprot:6443456-Prymnesium_polylepis.2